MEENSLAAPATAEQIIAYHQWWAGLSAPWKMAFNEVFAGRKSDEPISDEQLHIIWTTPALRFAGPKAMFPNMSFELDELSGIAALPNVQILVFISHRLDNLKAISHWTQLKSLFVFDNQLQSIEGVEGMSQLLEIYFHDNAVTSLQPLEHLINLHTVGCKGNLLETIDGIGPQHAETLRRFAVLPNEKLRDREIMRFEREVGIRCVAG